MPYIRDIVKPFAIKTIDNQKGMSKAFMEASWRNEIYNEDMDDLYDKISDFKVPISHLKDGMNALAALRPEIEEAYQFFNQNYTNSKFNKCPYYVTIHAVDEIRNVSFDYISSRFTKTFTNDISDVFSGKKKIRDVIDTYTAPQTQRDRISMAITTSMDTSMDIKRLSGYVNADSIAANPSTTKTVIMPFLVHLLDTRLVRGKQYNRFAQMGFDQIITETTRSFESATSDLTSARAAAIKSVKLTDGKYCSIKEIETLCGHAYILLYNIESFVVTMLLRMMRAYMKNVSSIIDLKSSLSIRDGISSKAFDESFLEDGEELEDELDDDFANRLNISITNNADIVTVADELSTLLVNTKLGNEFDLQDIVDRHCRVNMYLNGTLGRNTLVDDRMNECAMISMRDLATKLDSVCKNLTNEHADTPFSDYLEMNGLPVDIDKHILGIADKVETYNKPYYPNYTPQVLFVDLQRTEYTITNLAEYFKNIKSLLLTTREAAVRMPEKFVPFSINTINDWIDSAVDALTQLDIKLGTIYNKRLAYIADFLRDTDPHPDVNIEVENDVEWFPLASQNELVARYEDAEEELGGINRYYVSLYQKKLRGEAFYEADGDNNQNNDNNGGNNQNNNQGNGPKVNDGDGKQDTTNVNNNQNNAADKAKAAIGKLSEKIKEVINKIIEAIQKVFDSGVKKKNLAFITKNKAFLLSRRYTNTSIDTIKYRKENTINLMQGCIDRANALGDNTLRTTDQKGLRNSLFGPAGYVPASDDFSADLVKMFKVGKGSLDYVKVADNELKELVPEMINYCENYYNKFIDNLTAFRDKITSSPLDNKKNQGENDNTEENIRIITSDLVSALGALRVAARDRSNEYMKLLQGLAQSNANASTDENSTNDNNDNNGGNNNNQ
jgi:hypothetical protein